VAPELADQRAAVHLPPVARGDDVLASSQDSTAIQGGAAA
jgi:hypothetical protein